MKTTGRQNWENTLNYYKQKVQQQTGSPESLEELIYKIEDKAAATAGDKGEV